MRDNEPKSYRGLYGKFKVERTDGKSAPGEKHHGCDYFVLDLTHDPYAKAALRTYARECGDEYPALANDLMRKTRLGRSVPGCQMTENNSTLAVETLTFTGDQVCTLTGLTYRRLDYILTSRLIDHDDPKPGTGNPRTFTWHHLLLLAAIAKATDAGLALKPATKLATHGTITHHEVTITIDTKAIESRLKESLNAHAE
jgi:DNA-binding transcriptional MerR regulator